jgi:exosortase
MSAKRFAALVIVIALAALYWDLFRRLAYLWWNYDYAGHGMFVPLFSAVIAAAQRDRLRDSATRGHWGGLVVIALGVAIFALGASARSLVVEGMSVPVAVAGLVMLAFGPDVLRLAAFPVAFLTLMVPLPQHVADAVTIHLQMFAAGVAGVVLGLFGIPFFMRDGVTIELAGATLLVAEACNGLRFLIGLFVLTLAYAHMTQDGWWRKAVLAAAAVPVAIVANAIRVAAISTAAHFVGGEAVLGTPHLVLGKVVWIGTIVGLIALGIAMRRVGRHKQPLPVPTRVAA